MGHPTAAVETLRKARGNLRISQSELARLSGVSRYKICLFELGDGHLSASEQSRISAALKSETQRLRQLQPDLELAEACRLPHLERHD